MELIRRARDRAARRLLRRHRLHLAGRPRAVQRRDPHRRRLPRRRRRDGHRLGRRVRFSQGPKEYAECLLKMKFLTDPVKPFELIETHAVRRGRAAASCCSSATSSGWPPRRAISPSSTTRRAVRRALARCRRRQRRSACACACCSPRAARVTVTTTPLPPADPDAVMRFAVSTSRVDSADLFLFHKTTRRELYDREWQDYADRLGTDEVDLSQRARRAGRGQPHHDLHRARRRAADAGAQLRGCCPARCAPS